MAVDKNSSSNKTILNDIEYQGMDAKESGETSSVPKGTVDWALSGAQAPIIDMDEFLSKHYAPIVVRKLTDKILKKERELKQNKMKGDKGGSIKKSEELGIATNFLLEGPPGVGKTTALLLFNNYVLPYLVAYEYISRKYGSSSEEVNYSFIKNLSPVRISIENKDPVSNKTKEFNYEARALKGITRDHLDDYTAFMLSPDDFYPLTTFGSLLKTSWEKTGKKGLIAPEIIDLIEDEEIKQMIRSLNVKKISDFSEFTRFEVSMNFNVPVIKAQTKEKEFKKVSIKYFWTHLSLSAMSETLIENISIGLSKKESQRIPTAVTSMIRDTLLYSDIIIIDEYNRVPKANLDSFLNAMSTLKDKIFVYIGNLGDSRNESFVKSGSEKTRKKYDAFLARIIPFAIKPSNIFRPATVYILANKILGNILEDKENKSTNLEEIRRKIIEKLETVYDVLTQVKNYSTRSASKIFELLIAGVDVDDLHIPEDIKELIRLIMTPSKETLKIENEFENVVKKLENEKSNEKSKRQETTKSDLATFDALIQKEEQLETMIDFLMKENKIEKVSSVTMEYYLENILRPVLNYFFIKGKQLDEPLVLGAFGLPGTAKTTLMIKFLNKQYPYELQRLMEVRNKFIKPQISYNKIEEKNFENEINKAVEEFHKNYGEVIKEITAALSELNNILRKIKEKIETATSKKANNNLLNQFDKMIQKIGNIESFIENLYGQSQITYENQSTEEKLLKIEKEYEASMKEIAEDNDKEITIEKIKNLVVEISNFIDSKMSNVILEQVKDFQQEDEKSIEELLDGLEKIEKKVIDIEKKAQKLYLNVLKVVYSPQSVSFYIVRVGNVSYKWSIIVFSPSAIKFLKSMIIPKVTLEGKEETTGNIQGDKEEVYKFSSDVISFVSEMINRSDIIVFDEATRLPDVKYYDILLKALSDRSNKVFLMTGNIMADEPIKLSHLSKAFKDRLIVFKIAHKPGHKPEKLVDLAVMLKQFVKKTIIYIILSETLTKIFVPSQSKYPIEKIFVNFEAIKNGINEIISIAQSKINEVINQNEENFDKNDKIIKESKDIIKAYMKELVFNLFKWIISSKNKNGLKEETIKKIDEVGSSISAQITNMLQQIFSVALGRTETIKTKQGVVTQVVYDPRSINKLLDAVINKINVYNNVGILNNVLNDVLLKWEWFIQSKLVEKKGNKNLTIKDIEINTIYNLPLIISYPSKGFHDFISDGVKLIIREFANRFYLEVSNVFNQELVKVLSKSAKGFEALRKIISTILSYETLQNLLVDILNSTNMEDLSTNVNKRLSEISKEFENIFKTS
ncbi:MAG: hypothetical protein N3E37_04520 [Candidatus Micrarchaeota archaeon]|nr:hypothetical protein [Candidatus Micrarchaeota archaeon]